VLFRARHDDVSAAAISEFLDDKRAQKAGAAGDVLSVQNDIDELRGESQRMRVGEKL